MAFKSSLLLILVFLLHSVAEGKFDRKSFPANFTFGTASSAYQYEGATGPKYKQDSIWDTFVKDHPEKVTYNTGRIAEELYFRYKDDIIRMKELGLDAFRFSIAWSRLINYDQDGNLLNLNQAGVEFYRNLTDEIVSHGMKPFVTLFHWDTPQHLEKHGGFLNNSIVDQFVEYANASFHLFGDKVKHWITFNEPHNFCAFGYASGQFAPGRCTNNLQYGDIIALRRFSSSEPSNCSKGNSSTEPYIVARHILLAHAKAVRLYWDRYKNQTGSVGITLNVNWVLPWDNTTASKNATERALAFTFGWFMDPLYNGQYPSEMVEYVGKRLQLFNSSESKLLTGAYDFIGLNYYTATYAMNITCPKGDKSYLTDSCVNLTYYNASNDPIGQQASSWIYIYGQGIKDLMLYAKQTYGNPVIYVTENGVNIPNSNATFGLHDALRIEYLRDHLSNLSLVTSDTVASASHVNVQGYFVWSFLDNFEWASGYGERFGLVYIDYTNNLTRENKDSAKWLKNFLKP